MTAPGRCCWDYRKVRWAWTWHTAGSPNSQLGLKQVHQAERASPWSCPWFGSARASFPAPPPGRRAGPRPHTASEYVLLSSLKQQLPLPEHQDASGPGLGGVCRSFSTGYLVTAHLRPAGRYSPYLQTGMWGLESKRQSRDCCLGNPHSLPPTRGANRHYMHPPCQASSTPQGRGWVPQHPARARHNEGAQVSSVEQTKEPAGQFPHYRNQGWRLPNPRKYSALSIYQVNR